MKRKMVDARTKLANSMVLHIVQETKENPMFLGDVLCRIGALIMFTENATKGEYTAESPGCIVKLTFRKPKKRRR